MNVSDKWNTKILFAKTEAWASWAGCTAQHAVFIMRLFDQKGSKASAAQSVHS